MTIEYVLAWFAVMFPLVFSPGPANIVFALSGALISLLFGFPSSTILVCAFVVPFDLGKTLTAQEYPIH